MQLRRTTLVTLFLCAFTFSSLHSSCEAAEIASRFLYHNPESANLNADADADEANAEGQNAAAAADIETNAIPMDFYRKLDNVSDISEFIELFVDEDSIDPQLGIKENLKRNVERSAAIRPAPAHCTPQDTIVPLKPLNAPENANIIYYPQCTRVKRCGGCCSSELMSCQPTETETITMEVAKYRYGEKKLLERELIPMEVHKRCKCSCRIKAEDCNSYQIYKPDRCGCVCTNNEEFEKCLGQPVKIWDTKDCRCACRDSQSCTTGTIYDENICKCIDPAGTIGVTDDATTASTYDTTLFDRRHFIVKAIEVEPDNSTIYRTSK